MEKPPFPKRADRPIAVTNVAVVTMEREELLPDRTLVMRSGRIERTGPADAISTDGIDASIRHATM